MYAENPHELEGEDIKCLLVVCCSNKKVWMTHTVAELMCVRSEEVAYNKKSHIQDILVLNNISTALCRAQYVHKVCASKCDTYFTTSEHGCYSDFQVLYQNTLQTSTENDYANKMENLLEFWKGYISE